MHGRCVESSVMSKRTTVEMQMPMLPHAAKNPTCTDNVDASCSFIVHTGRPLGDMRRMHICVCRHMQGISVVGADLFAMCLPCGEGVCHNALRVDVIRVT